MRPVSIYSHDLQDHVRREQPGAYGYPAGDAILLVTGGRLKDRYVYEHYGFGWHDQVGGLRVERSLVPAGRETEIAAQIQAGEIEAVWLASSEWIDVITIE